MKVRLGLGLFLLGASGILGCLTAGTPTDALRENLKSHITYLASDSLGGRFVGTPGIEMAGRYIAGEFESIGLEPAFDGSYFQQFEIEVGFELLSPPAFRLGEMELAHERDFSVLPFSGSGQVSGRLAAWSDGDSSRAAWVCCVVVDAARAEQRWTMTGRDGLLEWMRATGEACRRQGAAAVVFVSGDPEHPGASLHHFMISRTYAPLDIPALEVTFGAIDRILASRSLRMIEVTSQGTDHVESIEITPPLDCTIDVAAGPASIKVRNVGGLLKGKGQGYLVIGAHYDHLGYGDIASSQPWRREVHPGADDNASGVAGVIEIARILASRGRPERSVVFLTFTAEELGALGSEYYCANAPYPIDSTVAMINLDCIGRLENGKLIAFGARSAEELSGLLEDAVSGHEINIIEKQEIYGFSDQNPFYARGIPALHFFTGAHTDYHSPDDVPDKINFDGEASVTSFVADFASLLAFAPTKLTPVVTEPETTEKISRGNGAHLGIIPDFTYAGTGVGIKGTVPGSPAEQAGLLDGDVIVGIDDRPIMDLRGLMIFLAGSSPGDTIEIQVMRAPVVEALKAVLSVRSPEGHSD
jgi:aminopeptidase YwaD